jgi:CRP-like cAMP-binding protein
MKPDKGRAFDIGAFLESTSAAKKMVFKSREVVFSQGDPAKNIMYLQRGMVQLSAISHTGKTAIVAILGPGDFFGLWCLAGFPLRMATATAVAPSCVFTIKKGPMLRLLRTRHAFSDRFIFFLLAQNIRIERDLLDLHFNSAEKRLAGKLLLLARYGMRHGHESLLAKVSQDTLAKMTRTTRARVNLFMNKFRRLGFIDYNNDRLKVHHSLVSVVLDD